MTEIVKQGLFEEIQQAVQPLVAGGNFRLNLIEDNSSERFIFALLSSPDIDIRFSFSVVTGGDEISCLFYVKKAQKRFYARYLFPTFGIDIPIATDDSLIREEHLNKRHREFERLQIKDMDIMTWMDNKFREYHRIHGIDHYPLENTGYIRELYRLSMEINRHLPEILGLFAPDTVEKTYLQYRDEQKTLEEIFRKKRRDPLSAITGEKPNNQNVPADMGKRHIGKYEEVMNQIGDLRDISPRHIVTYHPPMDTIDILFLQLNILIHQERDNNVTAYFIMSPAVKSYSFIEGREELVRERKMLVFSGSNVFQLLGIPNSDNPMEYPANIGEMCQMIQNNLATIRDAFGKENIGKTYLALIDMDNIIDKEIQETINRYFADVFGPPL
jgi:hypothetical protein